MKGQLALITGASRGIGRAIAIEFAGHGWDVAVTARSRRDMLEETKRLAEEQQVRCYPFIADVGERETAGHIFDALGEQGLNVDVLVNNAGIGHVGLLQDTTWEEWQRLVSVNLTGCYAMCREAIPSMVWNHRGKIINISSVWGVCGASCEVAYSATKGGMNALTRALARELAPSNIQVNAIACGAIDTDMNRWMTEEERRALEEEIPAGRMGQPEEVARLALQLAEGHDYLTGQVIQLDGGWI